MNLENILAQALEAVASASEIAQLEDIRVNYLGKKGEITSLLKTLGKIAPEERKEAGQVINQAKQDVQAAINEKRELLASKALEEKLAAETIDVTLPGRVMPTGGLHPVTRTIERIESFFGELGFEVKSGPEIEDDFHNFDALNIPEHHPARADHDTFYFNPKLVLRT
ncbi:MAG: phenylalanine--tRNA ligase subunit alpha, partial [Pseudoalteromonas distincta]